MKQEVEYIEYSTNIGTDIGICTVQTPILKVQAKYRNPSVGKRWSGMAMMLSQIRLSFPFD